MGIFGGRSAKPVPGTALDRAQAQTSARSGAVETGPVEGLNAKVSTFVERLLAIGIDGREGFATSPQQIAGLAVASMGESGVPIDANGQALYDNDKSEAVPDVEANKDKLNVVGWEMKPGDAVAFNFRTLHGAPANHTKNRRRAVSFRWVGDDGRFVKRLGRTSPPFPNLQFETGQPFGGPEFPAIWPAA